MRTPRARRHAATSSVGRGKAVTLTTAPATSAYRSAQVTLHHGDSLMLYEQWASPTCIISDGAYGVLGFEGDTAGHGNLAAWYKPHIHAWSRAATPLTTLWFWNSEIGWAAVHSLLEAEGWRYVQCNIWNKGRGHIAGNVNSTTLRRFPVVTEVCVQYVFAAQVGGQSLQTWLRHEWLRSGLPLRHANKACGVRDAAVRKYFDQTHLWYFPPPDAMARLSDYANRHGDPDGRPYFALDGVHPVNADSWSRMRAKFRCPHGVTNVWERPAMRGAERVKTAGGRAVHLNQKPLDLMTRIITASTDAGDIVWEPFGGLFSGALAGQRAGRRVFAAELDSTYYQYGVRRFSQKREDVSS